MVETVQLKDGRSFQVRDGFKQLPVDKQRAVVDQWKRENPLAAPSSSGPDTLSDVGSSAARGLTEGVIGLAGTPGDFRDLSTRAANYLRGKVGLDPAKETMIPGDIPIPKPETSAQLEEMAKEAAPGLRPTLEYEPKTRAGKLARTGASFAPGAALGPGRLTAKGLQWAGSTLASEGLGQAAEAYAPALEPYARVAGAVVGGVPGARRSVRQADELIPSTEDYRRMKTDAYRQASQSGNVLHPTDFDYIVSDLTARAAVSGGGTANSSLAPSVQKALAILRDRASTRIPLSVDDIDTMRQTLRMGIDVMKPTERNLLRQLVDRYDQLVDHAVPPELRRARQLNVRYKKSEQMDILGNRMARQKPRFSQSGEENAIRERARNIANAEDSKIARGRRSQFNREERAALDQVAIGSPVRNFFTRLGKFAPTSPIPAATSGVAGGLAFGLTGSPKLAALAGGGLAGIGIASRRIATAMARGDLRRAEELIRAGPHTAAQAQRLRSELRRAAFVRALLAGHQAPQH